VPGFSKHFWLVLLYPQYLWRGKAGQRIVPGDLDQALLSQPGADFVTLCAGALVVPQDCWPQHHPVFVQQGQPVHLPGQANALDGFAREASLGQYRANTLYRAVPPIRGVLFAP